MSTLHYTEAGTGTPFVLLHAFPLDSEMWRPQWEALGSRFGIVAIDLPGYGQSPAQPGWSVDSAADGVAEVLAKLALPRVVVGGLSLGGYVAMAFARRHADRLSGLILADTRSETDDAPGKDNRNRLIALTKEFGPSKVYEGMLPKVLCDETRAKRPAVVENVRAIAARQSADGVIGGLAALRDRPDATPELDRIAVPTLILVGEEDGVTPPAMSESMAKRIRGSKLVRLPAAGHLSNVENPAAFNAALTEFLS